MDVSHTKVGAPAVSEDLVAFELAETSSEDDDSDERVVEE